MSLLPFRFGKKPPPPPLPQYHDFPPEILQSLPQQEFSSCVGPRGLSLDHPRSKDLPRPTFNLKGVDYPEPTYGSYTELGLDQTWMTFSQRWGPYGYGEEEDDYAFTKVKWDQINWARLQDNCLKRDPFSFTAQTGAPPRLRFFGDGDLQLNRSEIGKTGRQAIVVRTWSTYRYTEEDMWNIRSLITEASLATDGQYTVFLLVDYKTTNGSYIHESDERYREALAQSVPPEFRDIAVLFDVSLQKSWYEKVEEFRPMWQIMQPLQLFAYFYPEFDHYWQFEMDTRFTSHAGKMLRQFHNFGAKQPYKQSRERASWTYIPRIHGTYAEFSEKVNNTLEGNATVWGPVPIIDVPDPLKPRPPMNDSQDNFKYGLDEDADLLLLSPLFEVKRFNKYEDWVFKDWIRGFSQLSWEVPRFSNAPAQARAGRNLLHAIHSAQHEKGLRVPSEATLPSFALWNGLKVVQVPQPNFQWPTRSIQELNVIHNGGEIRKFKDGIANGAAPYMKSVIEFYARPRTWEWQSSLIDPVFERWRNGDKATKKTKGAGGDAETVQDSATGKKVTKRQMKAAALGDVPDERPPFMAEGEDGKIYCPGLLVHPRKTNHNFG